MTSSGKPSASLRLTILNVASPFLPLLREAHSGIEQMLAHLDRALVRAGHRSLVLAPEGSEATGTLIPVRLRTKAVGSEYRDEAYELYRAAIDETLTRWNVDVVHLHGLDFDSYLPAAGVPVLATLHHAPDQYPPEIFYLDRPDTFLNCVSRPQRETCPPGTQLLPDIETGIPVGPLRADFSKRNYVLSLGRVCWEKGFHLAFQAAAKAGCDFVLAGESLQHPSHRDYFNNVIRPKLTRKARYLGPVSFAHKRRLLTSARALLVPSLVPETSCLVAMEAMACGTPVIGFRLGALQDLIDDGRTGFLVESADEMAAAIQACDQLDSVACRATAEARFSIDHMTDKYLDVYERLAARGTHHPSAVISLKPFAA